MMPLLTGPPLQDIKSSQDYSFRWIWYVPWHHLASRVMLITNYCCRFLNMASPASQPPAGRSHLGGFFLWSWSIGLWCVELTMSLRAMPWGGGPSRDRQIMTTNPQLTLVAGTTTWSTPCLDTMNSTSESSNAICNRLSCDLLVP